MGINANMLVPVPITKKILLKDKNSACLPNALPTKVLQTIKPLLPVLTKIINLSLVEGVFIEEWKVWPSTTQEARTGSDKQKLQAS